ncbi:thermostable hemolysin [Vibrio viridaestus]|uniref:Delta-VPH n=1 Tax=Vibrio viridaestus TaxID=2487322 RepID=A0A3N9TKS8_9VIBR|nr:thermostable hemolysin [Vibrio viridaestus]RQW64880.1 delta-VPH [Vibrio viridaestus]
MKTAYSGFELKLVDGKHPQKSEIENYIYQRYSRAFQATLNEFMPQYLVLYQHEKLISACGFQHAQYRPLFLEQYLDEPIELLIKRHFGVATRSSIIEFGQLASFSNRFSLIHFSLMTSYLIEQGFEWCVCTVTAPLFALMERMGLKPLSIGSADPLRVDGYSNWGQYYSHQPQLVLGNLKVAQSQLTSLATNVNRKFG